MKNQDKINPDIHLAKRDSFSDHKYYRLNRLLNDCIKRIQTLEQKVIGLETQVEKQKQFIRRTILTEG